VATIDVEASEVAVETINQTQNQLKQNNSTERTPLPPLPVKKSTG